MPSDNYAILIRKVSEIDHVGVQGIKLDLFTLPLIGRNWSSWRRSSFVPVLVRLKIINRFIGKYRRHETFRFVSRSDIKYLNARGNVLCNHGYFLGGRIGIDIGGTRFFVRAIPYDPEMKRIPSFDINRYYCRDDRDILYLPCFGMHARHHRMHARGVRFTRDKFISFPAPEWIIPS